MGRKTHASTTKTTSPMIHLCQFERGMGSIRGDLKRSRKNRGQARRAPGIVGKQFGKALPKRLQGGAKKPPHQFPDDVPALQEVPFGNVVMNAGRALVKVGAKAKEQVAQIFGWVRIHGLCEEANGV